FVVLNSFIRVIRCTYLTVKTGMRPVSHRLAFLGPGFQPARFRFLIESPFWGQVFSQQDSGLSSNRLFGAVFSATTKTQVCHRLVITFLGPGE
ncbi:MAG: hypothetical protein B6247_23575, partial [Candidatus Parabeggiatoa sp. nov. 2]